MWHRGTGSLVIVDADLHGSVGLDTPDEVASGGEERFVKVLHRLHERLGHRGFLQGLPIAACTNT